MASFSYARHQFPPVIIRHALWLYLRFSLSYRDRPGRAPRGGPQHRRPVRLVS